MTGEEMPASSAACDTEETSTRSTVCATGATGEKTAKVPPPSTSSQSAGVAGSVTAGLPLCRSLNEAASSTAEGMAPTLSSGPTRPADIPPLPLSPAPQTSEADIPPPPPSPAPQANEDGSATTEGMVPACPSGPTHAADIPLPLSPAPQAIEVDIVPPPPSPALQANEDGSATAEGIVPACPSGPTHAADIPLPLSPVPKESEAGIPPTRPIRSSTRDMQGRDGYKSAERRSNHSLSEDQDQYKEEMAK